MNVTLSETTTIRWFHKLCIVHYLTSSRLVLPELTPTEQFQVMISNRANTISTCPVQGFRPSGFKAVMELSGHRTYSEGRRASFMFYRFRGGNVSYVIKNALISIIYISMTLQKDARPIAINRFRSSIVLLPLLCFAMADGARPLLLILDVG